jgi:hypothetical protein
MESHPINFFSFFKVKSLKDVCSCVSLSICKFLFSRLHELFELVQNVDSQKLNVLTMLNHIFFPTFHHYSNICCKPHIYCSLQILGYLEYYCKISPKATISYNL